MEPLIIFDTDMDTDCDDAGALAMLLEAHKKGLVRLLGIVSDSVCRYAAPCCEAISDFYGVNVPIGTIYADDYFDSESNIERFKEYRAHTEKCASQGRDYNRVFSEEIGKVDKDYPSAVSIYRKLLADAEDSSVTILCVGMLTALSEALSSDADSVSNLSGAELFRKKVKKVVTMGDPDKINDFNWGMDAEASEKFFSLCDVPIYISAEGGSVITGEMLTKTFDAKHLIRRAYEKWLKKENCGRSSWDLIATLYAVNQDTKHIKVKERGNCSFVAKEKKLYTENSETALCKTIHADCSDEEMAKLLNECMAGNFDNI